MVYNCCVTIHNEISRNVYGEQNWESGTESKARVIEKSAETIRHYNDRGESMESSKSKLFTCIPRNKRFCKHRGDKYKKRIQKRITNTCILRHLQKLLRQTANRYR